MMFRTLSIIAMSMTLLMSQLAHAGLFIDRTRVIVVAGSSSAFDIGNDTQAPYAMQAWVTDPEGNEPGRNVQVSPSFSMIAEDSKQPLRLVSFAKESKQEQLYYLYVQEIPPKAEAAKSESLMQIALRYKIKVFVRPESISEGRRGAENQLVAKYTSTGLELKNPTPYYFALTQFEIGKKVYHNDEMGLFKPFSTVEIDNVSNHADEINISYLSDRGGLRTTLIKAE
ncbi:hypothetical protein AX279_03940 [Pseudomonas sp. J237]|nr:hypothetical protein AX279_03940 [Pseudomonas sp. J237]